MAILPLLPHHIESVHMAILDGPEAAANTAFSSNPDFALLRDQGRLTRELREQFSDYFSIPALHLLLEGKDAELAKYNEAFIRRSTAALTRYITPEQNDSIRFVLRGTDLICMCFPGQTHCNVDSHSSELRILQNLTPRLGGELKYLTIRHASLVRILSEITYNEMFEIAFPI